MQLYDAVGGTLDGAKGTAGPRAILLSGCSHTAHLLRAARMPYNEIDSLDRITHMEIPRAPVQARVCFPRRTFPRIFFSANEAPFEAEMEIMQLFSEATANIHTWAGKRTVNFGGNVEISVNWSN
ncbi:MAG: hypothetical protein K0R28_5834 [Paenibacillus sp.]|nr:hypothetical protein [Paenibacillus sp.]